MSQNPWARPEHPDEQSGGASDDAPRPANGPRPGQPQQGTWAQPSFLAGSWPQQPQQGAAPPQAPGQQDGVPPQGWTQQPQGQPWNQQAPPQAYPEQQAYPSQAYPQQPYPQQGHPQQPSAPQQFPQQGWQSAPPPSMRQVQPYAAPPVAGRSSRYAAALGDTPVTSAIVAICVLVWLGEFIVPGFFDRVALTPAYARTQPWRFVTSAFAHSTTILHLGFNMLALWSLRMLEPFLGRLRYVATYLLCALAGGAAVVLLSSPTQQSWYTEVIGASGAIFGLFGVLVFALREVRASTNQLWAVIGLNLVISFTVPDIAWQAHIGGFLMGLLSGWLLVRERRNRLQGRADRSWLWLGVLFVGVIALIAVKYALSPALG